MNRTTFWVPIIVALIAAASSIAGLVITYRLTEEARTEIAAQSLAQERLKVEIMAAGQKTAEAAASVALARFELERKIAKSNEDIESKKIQIERHRDTREETRLTPDFTKLSNDLRPNLSISCTGRTHEMETLRINCIFKNLGVHPATVEPKVVSLLNRDNQKELPGTIQSIENAFANTILPNGSGSNLYEILLTPAGVAAKDRIVRLTFDAKTDATAIAITKRLSKGVITDKELQSLSSQQYTQQVFY